jgi:hypothetical protein
VEVLICTLSSIVVYFNLKPVIELF